MRIDGIFLTYNGIMLEVKNLKLSFPNKEAIKGINFEIQEGEILALVGESGSGKTLTALSIMGLQPATAKTEGKILLKDKSIQDYGMHNLRGKKIALIPQDPLGALNPVYTAGQQVVEAIAVHTKDLSNKEMKAKAIEYFTKVGIPAPERCFDSYPHELSGGMRQRVMIAMAIINDPDLLIADEPTTALDVTVQAVILKLLKKLGKTILFITHDLGVVAEIADRVIVMKEGQIIESSDIFDIFESPKEEYTKNLLAAIPSI